MESCVFCGDAKGNTSTSVIYEDLAKFNYRYATFAFSEKANLDGGHPRLVDYALTELTSIEEAKIVALLKRAVS